MKKFLKWLLLLILAGAIAAGGWFFIDGVQPMNMKPDSL